MDEEAGRVREVSDAAPPPHGAHPPILHETLLDEVMEREGDVVRATWVRR